MTITPPAGWGAEVGHGHAIGHALALQRAGQGRGFAHGQVHVTPVQQEPGGPTIIGKDGVEVAQTHALAIASAQHLPAAGKDKVCPAAGGDIKLEDVGRQGHAPRAHEPRGQVHANQLPGPVIHRRRKGDLTPRRAQQPAVGPMLIALYDKRPGVDRGPLMVSLNCTVMV